MHGETLEQLVARINAGCHIPSTPPTAATVRRKIMAQKVKLAKGKEFEFKSGGGAAGKYPWDEWFNGDLLMLERNDEHGKKDFDVETDAMPPKIKTAARRRYKVVQVSRRDADGHKMENAVIIKARDMNPEERAAEDLLRAEEKASRKAAKAEANGTPATV